MTGEDEGPPRLRRYEITGPALKGVMSPGTHRIEAEEGEHLPFEAEVRRLGYDYEHDIIYLIAEHESFDPVPEGMEIPEGTVTVTTVRTEEPTHGA